MYRNARSLGGLAAASLLFALPSSAFAPLARNPDRFVAWSTLGDDILNLVSPKELTPPKLPLIPLDEFEIHDLLMQRSLQMLLVSLSLEKDCPVSSREWLVNFGDASHGHLSTPWHSILGMCLHFNEFLIGIFESAGAEVGATNPESLADGAVDSRYTADSLARLVLSMNLRMAEVWRGDLAAMARFDSPNERARVANERKRVEHLGRKARLKFKEAVKSEDAAVAARAPQYKELAATSDALLLEFGMDPLDKLCAQPAAPGEEEDLGSRLKFENAELLTRVTTLEAVRCLGAELRAAARKPSAKPGDVALASWFDSRVDATWRPELADVCASKQTYPATPASDNSGDTAKKDPPQLQRRLPPRPKSAAHALLRALEAAPPQRTQVGGAVVYPASLVPRLLDYRYAAAAGLAKELEATGTRVLEAKRSMLERALLRRAFEGSSSNGGGSGDRVPPW